ncbi:MAG: MCE family protein [Nocardioides sp.]|nr:MCE family protein [Nocardioides sp.]
MASKLGLRGMGVLFLVLVLSFIWVTYAVFAKKFVAYDDVTLRSSKIGLQLPTRADVKFRGVIVGEVRSVRSTGDGAELVLGIYPKQREGVPAGVEAQILPKTLFGEKFIALDTTGSIGGEPIQPGDQIDQAEVAIEVEKVLSDLMPLLRTLEPLQLNRTLTAISTALDGRGNDLGENLEILDSYLERFNPQIPALVEDLRKTAEVARIYNSVVPDLARTLRNSVTTGSTFLEKEKRIESFFNEVISFSGTTRDFLDANGDNMIRLANQGAEILPVFEQHAPIFPCFFEGLARIAPRQAEAFRGHTLHINLETLPNQPRGYGPQDDPRFGDRSDPVDLDLCERAIAGEWHQNNLPPQSLVPEINDGVDEPTGKGRSPNRPAPAAAPSVDMSSGYAGTRAEQEVVGSIVGPVLGRSFDDVPAIATLLFAPLARGTEVSLR